MSQHVIDPYTGAWDSVEVPGTSCVLFAKPWRIPAVAASSVIKHREGLNKGMNKAMTVSCSTTRANCMPGNRSA